MLLTVPRKARGVAAELRNPTLIPALQPHPHPQVVVCGAAKHGRLDVIQFLWDLGILPGPECHQAAVGAGALQVCEWLEEHGVALSSVRNPGTLIREAVRHGKFHVLRWLVEERGIRMPLDEQLLCLAARGGDLEVLSYVLTPRIGRDYPAKEDWLTPDVLRVALLEAAAAGKLMIVRHLVEVYGAPIDPILVWSAMKSWCESAPRDGEPLDRLTVLPAGEATSADSPPGTARGTTAEMQGFSSRAELLRWARRKGCNIDGR